MKFHPPRILHVVRQLAVGGMEFGVVNLACRLDRLGFEQAVCCLEGPGELVDRLPKSVMVWACAKGGRPQRLPSRAAMHLRSWRPDVVHARNGGAWIDATVAWWLAGCRGRLAFSIHGWDRLDPMPRRRAFLFRQLARWTRGMAAVSAETARQFAHETGIPADRFSVLGSGVDTERFYPRHLPCSSGRLILGCVGRLDPVKAHNVLIDAFACVVGEGVADLELRLLGDGPCRPDLERYVLDRGLGDRVRFLGTSRDVPEQLRELDIFLLTSRREGRPTSIMEAMASGLPVVATRVGSIPELVTDEGTGLLVEPGDVEGLSNAIRRLVGDQSLRAALGAQGRQIALENLSLDRMVEQYAAFYRDVAGRP